jgi:chitinase
MKYSCDEFPPAAWIEGGVGTPGVGTPEGDGTDGNTYCAPIADGCGGTGTGTASEQNWQGTIHGRLKSILRKKIKALRGNNPKSDEAVAFKFRTATYVTQGHAARVYFRQGNNNVAVGSPSSGGSGTIIVPRAGPTPATGQHDRVLRRQIPHANATAMEKLEFGKGLSIADYADMGWISVDLMIDDSVPGQVTATFKMPDGEVIPAEQTTAMMRALDTFILPASNTSAIPDYISPSAMFTTEFSTDGSVQKSSDPAPWNISATDVEGMSTTYGLTTQQEPGKDRIDIIALSREYILAQIDQSNSTGNHSIQPEIKAHKDPTPGSTFGRLLRHRRSQDQAESAISPFSPLLNRAVEGPVQCGPGNPCKDESCCNKDGKNPNLYPLYLNLEGLC